MTNRWSIRPHTEEDLRKRDELAAELGLSPTLCLLLVQRGIASAREVRKFFKPNLNDLHDPFLMPDMFKAVKRLNKALGNKEKILIYGDYDVDGTTAVSLVYKFLRPYSSTIDFYIPDRYDEGYGVSYKSIDYAVENGISLIIFGGIIARIPTAVRGIHTQVKEGALSVVAVIALIVVAVLITVVIILMQQGTRKIPVQYAKRMVGRKMYGGQSTHIPIKVNQAGVIPIIFSLSLLQFPLTITYFVPQSSFAQWMSKYLSPSGNPGIWVYAILNITLTLFFTYFYTAITFKPEEVADNMRQSGGFVPGIRPGAATEEYLSRIMSRLCLVGGIFLAGVATIPTVVSEFTPLQLSFGGTSLLIAVGVALDTVQQIENQMLNRNYQGFLK